jgi:hypothetical protein
MRRGLPRRHPSSFGLARGGKKLGTERFEPCLCCLGLKLRSRIEVWSLSHQASRPFLIETALAPTVPSEGAAAGSIARKSWTATRIASSSGKLPEFERASLSREIASRSSRSIDIAWTMIVFLLAIVALPIATGPPARLTVISAWPPFMEMFAPGTAMIVTPGASPAERPMTVTLPRLL